MCPISDDLLSFDEVFLETLIQFDLLMDGGSIVTNSNPDLLNKPDFSIDRPSYIKSLDFSFEQQVSDPDEFDFSSRFFNSYDTEFVPTNSISLVDFLFSSEVDLIDYKPSDLGTIESSFIDSTLNTPFIEDSKVTCVFCQSDPHRIISSEYDSDVVVSWR